jgi:phage terminase small subunit
MPKHNTASGLTFKEERFVAEYIVDGNGTRAALAAGFAPRSAQRYASELLAKPTIRQAIAKELKAQEKRTLITADMVLKRIDRVARKAEAAGDFTAANQANRLLGQHYKLFTEKHEHGGMGGGPVQFQILPAEIDH